MSSKRLQELNTEISTLHNQVKAIWDKADADGIEVLPAEQMKQVKDLNKKLEEKDLEARELAEQHQAREQLNAREKELKTPADRLKTPREDQREYRQKLQKSAGRLLLEDTEFAEWRQRQIKNGGVSSAQFGNSPRVAVETKTLVTGLSSTSGGALIDDDFMGLQDTGTAFRELTIRDIITVGNTDSDTVSYVRQGAITNNAAPVAEASATGDGTGAKPESAFALSVVSETVKTIAHWIPATRRALADAGQLRTLIESILRYGLEEELEDQIVAGSGAGENFTGLLNVTGTTAQAWDTNLLTTTRRARTKVKVTGRATPTAYLFHPNDWEDFDLLVDNETRYYFGGPMVMGTPRLWGLPVIESEAMTEGTGMVADFRLAILWLKDQMEILVSDSHSDFFIRNLIAILAEMRGAFGVLRPAAFVEIDLTA